MAVGELQPSRHANDCGSAATVTAFKRRRECCNSHGILLIFDEGITRWGWLGASFVVLYFGVTPDMLTMAKRTNKSAAPMEVVAASAKIHNSIVIY